jgi:hypothetical protein
MPSLSPMARQSADRVAKFWFCGLDGDTVAEWMASTPAALFLKASERVCLSGA